MGSRVYRKENPYEYGRFGTTRFTLLAWPILIGAAATIGFMVGSLLQLVPAIGQVAAVGFIEAWNRYGTDWLIFAATASAVMVGVLLLAGVLDRIYVWRHRPGRPRSLGVFGCALFAAALFGSVWMTAYEAYRDAKGNVPSAEKPIIPKPIRSWLVSLLVDPENDRAELDASKNEATTIAAQLAGSRARVEQLRALLAGAEPITKRDLDKAQASGRIEGVILGIVSSIVASYIFAYLPRPRSKVSE